VLRQILTNGVAPAMKMDDFQFVVDREKSSNGHSGEVTGCLEIKFSRRNQRIEIVGTFGLGTRPSWKL